jgi:hypothetical protein
VGLDDDDEAALDALWEVNVKAPLRLVRAALASDGPLCSESGGRRCPAAYARCPWPAVAAGKSSFDSD